MKESRYPHALFDHIKRAHGLPTDTALAERVDIDKCNISRVRSGVKGLGADVRLRIMRCFDMTWQQVDELCPPEDFTE